MLSLELLNCCCQPYTGKCQHAIAATHGDVQVTTTTIHALQRVNILISTTTWGPQPPAAPPSCPSQQFESAAAAASRKLIFCGFLDFQFSRPLLRHPGYPVCLGGDPPHSPVRLRKAISGCHRHRKKSGCHRLAALLMLVVFLF